jgi:hypothetical protein
LEKTNKSIIEHSPCWQWNEALRIVDKVTNAGLQQQVLNNHAYAALLKVNERSSEVFTERGKRHFGARAAMDILEKTKVGYYVCTNFDDSSCSAFTPYSNTFLIHIIFRESNTLLCKQYVMVYR